MTVRNPVKTSTKERRIIEEKRKGYYCSLGYRSQSIATSEGRTYISYPGYRHDEADRKDLIAQSRDFDRNNAIYQGMIDRAVSYIIGNGFELQAISGSEQVNKKIEGLWKDWMKRPEIKNVSSGGETARMICREVIIAGDTLALKTNKALIQLFEAEQIAGRKPTKDGIVRDDYGRPQRFYLSPWKKHRVDTGNANPVKAGDCLYIANPKRPSQYRGVPACQAAFPMLHRINDVCDSEAIAWQLLARLAVSITHKKAEEEAYNLSREDPNKSSDQLEGDLATRLTELDYAIMFHGEPGEEVKGIERNIPGKNFSESLRTFLRLLGLPLGMPLELVLLDWTQSNYSQSRAVLQQAYQMFQFWQHKMRDFFYTPCFEWRLAAWRGQGLIGRKTKIRYEWIMQTFPWIDQLKEAQAYSTQVERGFITHGQVCKSLNTDRAEVLDRREAEVSDAIERAQRLSKKYKVEVPWRIFAGLKESPAKPSLAKTAGAEGQEKGD